MGLASSGKSGRLLLFVSETALPKASKNCPQVGPAGRTGLMRRPSPQPLSEESPKISVSSPSSKTARR